MAKLARGAAYAALLSQISVWYAAVFFTETMVGLAYHVNYCDEFEFGSLDIFSALQKVVDLFS